MTPKAMEQISTWEANSRSPDEEIPRLLLNLKTYFRVHNDLPSYLILRQLNLVHTFTVYIFEIHINILLPYTQVPKLFSSVKVSDQRMYTYLNFRMSTACSTHLQHPWFNL
jgi:hypothetical protein